ncbi:MAG: hypothetical protein ACR2Q3_07170 [Woeseiaceae bacterium]
MKKVLLAATMAALIMVNGIPTANAQENRPGVFPIEMWACSFLDRKDQDDMDSVYEQISEDSDAAYAAWQLNPYMVGNRAEQFDFLYVGAWQDGNVMGGDVESMFAGPYESTETWNETVDCSGFLYTGINIQDAPPQEDGHYFVSISDCSADKGVNNGQAVNGIRRYNDYLVENGQTVRTDVWFPVHGNGDADFDFKLIRVYGGPQAWGDLWQWRVNNMAVQQRRNYMQGVVSCDESRVYSTRTLMNTMN